QSPQVLNRLSLYVKLPRLSSRTANAHIDYRSVRQLNRRISRQVTVCIRDYTECRRVNNTPTKALQTRNLKVNPLANSRATRPLDIANDLSVLIRVNLSKG